MKMTEIPFGATEWSTIERTEHAGITGTATWRTQFFGPADNRIRVRMVDYSPGYRADHWCEKGHVLLCIAGELVTELADGSTVTLHAGMSYQEADGDLAHRSHTDVGARLFIVD